MLNAFGSKMNRPHARPHRQIVPLSLVEQRNPSAAEHSEIFERQNVRRRLWVTGGGAVNRRAQVISNAVAAWLPPWNAALVLRVTRAGQSAWRNACGTVMFGAAAHRSITFLTLPSIWFTSMTRIPAFAAK